MSKHFLERLKERYGIDLPKTWLDKEFKDITKYRDCRIIIPYKDNILVLLKINDNYVYAVADQNSKQLITAYHWFTLEKGIHQYSKLVVDFYIKNWNNTRNLYFKDDNPKRKDSEYYYQLIRKKYKVPKDSIYKLKELIPQDTKYKKLISKYFYQFNRETICKF